MAQRAYRPGRTRGVSGSCSTRRPPQVPAGAGTQAAVELRRRLQTGFCPRALSLLALASCGCRPELLGPPGCAEGETEAPRCGGVGGGLGIPAVRPSQTVGVVPASAWCGAAGRTSLAAGCGTGRSVLGLRRPPRPTAELPACPALQCRVPDPFWFIKIGISQSFVSDCLVGLLKAVLWDRCSLTV